MAESALGTIEGAPSMKLSRGQWMFDEDDWLLMAMLMDPINCAELLFEDTHNYSYSGCYIVMDYQYPLFRWVQPYQGFPCARSVGKTESIKARAVSHAFRRQREDLLITAPELIHLDPLTQQIEWRITSTRLTREFLRKDAQRTGFTHKPFQCDFADGTRIIGRIPKMTGTGVKGMHEPDCVVDEGQDYPERGWIELQETVMKDHVDTTGDYDFTFHFYGVHAGGRGGKFHELSTSRLYKITAITAPMRPGWNKQEKESAAAMYGGTTSADYRRNILGEPGTALNAFFVMSRLMACIDQEKESRYNTTEWFEQKISAEQLDQLIRPGDDIGPLLNLPDNLGQEVYAGMDIGLVNDPTVIMIAARLPDTHKKLRMKLVCMIHLQRMREHQIIQAWKAIGFKYGLTLRSFGVDITGLGLPIHQAMGREEDAPEHLLEVTRGYVFNAKVPIAVDPNYTSKVNGQLKDQYSNMVEIVRDPWTGQEKMIVRMTMIEASTRYLSRWVDDAYLWLPFHPDLVGDMQGETEQRVKAMAGMKKKPNAFHMLDALRALAMGERAADTEAQVYSRKGAPVLVRSVPIPSGG